MIASLLNYPQPDQAGSNTNYRPYWDNEVSGQVDHQGNGAPPSDRKVGRRFFIL
jgi:hypothetical protein